MSHAALLDVAVACGLGSAFFLWLAGWLFAESLRPKPIPAADDDVTEG